MNGTASSIRAKSFWTMGTYVASTAIRFGGNIILSRVLGPEIMGIAVIAQAIRNGCELLSDFGFEQNVVRSPNGEDGGFLDTIWTMQILRGAIISLACLALAPTLAGFYGIDVWLMVALSAAPLLTSLMSTAPYTMARQLEVKRRNLFELGSEAAGLAITVALAVTLRSAWAPILAILLSFALRSALTYPLLHRRPTLRFDRRYVREIVHYSKWIMLSSLAFYAAIYIDRLYLGAVVSLAMLGIYGLARSIGDMPNTVAGRLGFQVVFPFVAHNDGGFAPGSTARRELGRTRAHFLILVLVGVATVMAWADMAVLALYGQRFAAAGWMVCVLLAGSWIAVLASLGEATVFGGGKPSNVSTANLLRFAVMGAVLPLGFHWGGMPGALLALPASELVRYLSLLRAQYRIGVAFLAQDVALSLGFVGLFGGWIALRLALGLGVPWALMG